RDSQSGNGHGGHRDVDAEFPAGADHQALRRVSLLVRQPRVLRRLRARLPAAALPDGRVGDEAPRARGEVLLVAPRAVLVRVDAPARLEEALRAAAAGRAITIAVDAETAVGVARTRPELAAAARAAFADGRLAAMLTCAHGGDA